jgi:hypothetical protein
LPSFVDWLTQSCKLRESRNFIRASTGYFLGISWGLFAMMLIRGMFFHFAQAIAVLLIYFTFIYVVAWKTGFVDSYLEENMIK